MLGVLCLFSHGVRETCWVYYASSSHGVCERGMLGVLYFFLRYGGRGEDTRT